MKIRRFLPLAIATLALAPAASFADGPDLFSVSASGVVNVTQTGNKLSDLLEDAIKGRGAFTPTFNNSVNLAVNYAGIANAMGVSIVDNGFGGVTGTLHINNGAFTKTFTAGSRDELQTQIEDFFTEDTPGRDEALKQLKKIWAKTPITITDGTPHASTAMLANRTFDEFGLRLGKTRAERAKLDAGETLLHSHFGIEASAGTFETKGGYTGRTTTVAPTLRFGDRYGFVLSLPVRYIDLQGAESAEAALVAGLPLQLISENKDSHLFWQVTPHAHAAAAASEDLIQGGLEVGGGLTNRVGYNFGGCTVTVGNQIGHFQGIDAVGVDTGVKQLLMKNGVAVSIPVMSHWLVETRAVRTDFLRDAPFDEYYTFGADLVYRSEGGSPWYLFLIPDDLYVGVAYDMDFKDYTAPSVRAGAKWTW